ncbi:Xylose isomerase-like TIM barrel [compost metagenome]|uniref:TIM barrel protein n=1 Tax=Pseudomonas capeferrum TaxID=1495066 RepID=A0ABY7R3L2_9PSED|nr:MULTISPECIES: TIM barrel protein [Pseudomonas]MDD2066080.1 sugar phosphate isomerase/epimerase [Pseudomonas sp. 25571]MDD2130568.1 sugar phosphate isomerase/epimerase [Pseudomonas sp. 17391]MUT53869.1 TIM barrel protein [Pseudomonas sp. TDA1]UPL08123.1 Xylose isomerase-like TIM barrel [Pseudomonas sp. IsoF]WCH98196.1 TIM barrel protein [Pseudomonas capeferrum]
MNNKIQERFNALLSHNVVEHTAAPMLTPALAQRLLERLAQVRLFAHAYPLLTNLTHGHVTPADLLDFAYRHELQGLSLHVLDGEQNSLSQMSPGQLQAFADKAQALGLDVHVEISSTLKQDVDQVIAIAKALGVRNIRVYSRYEGTLSRVMDIIESDLHYLAQQADAHDLYFDFEQHEELKSDEIAQLLKRLDHPRLHALFDFGNMINACEQPLQALRNLAPHIRQSHLKGVRIVAEQNGFGHYGVLQGSAEDDLPSARMLYELLMLGDTAPQVIAFILEQENHYVAPAFRQQQEAADPFIAYREMSETPLPAGFTLARMLADEHRWANNQVAYVRGLLGEFRTLAELTLANA